MMKVLIRLGLALLSLFAIIALFLTLTPTGLPTTLKIANLLLPGELTVKSLSGSILRKIEAERITYKEGELYIHLEDVSLDWKPGRLINKTLYIQDLRAERVLIKTPKSSEPKERETLDLANFTSEYTFILNQADLYHITWENYHTEIDRFAGTLIINPLGLRIRDMYVLHGYSHYNLSANIGPGFSPNIHVESRQRISFDQVQMVNGKTYIEGDLEELQLQQAFTRGIIGELKANFTDITGNLNVLAEGHANIEDVSKINQNLAGHLTLDLALNYQHSDGNGNFSLTSNGSEINQLPLIADFHAEIKDYIAHWQDNHFILGDNSISTSGYYGRSKSQINWNIHGEKLAQISRRLYGTVQSSGTFNQDGSNINIQANLSADNFRFVDYHVKTLRSPNMRWGNAPESAINLDLTAQQLRHRRYTVDTLVAKASGIAKDHQINIEANTTDNRMQANIKGTIDNNTYNAQLSQLNLNLMGNNLYTLSNSVVMTFSENQVNFNQPICIIKTGSKLCLNYSRNITQNQFSLEALAFPSNIISQSLNRFLYFTGDFDLNANAAWETGDLPTEAALNLSMKPGKARLGQNRQRDWFSFGASQISLNLNKNTLETQGDLDFIKDDFIRWHALVHHWQTPADANINAHLRANIKELEPLKFFILQTDDFGADLQADLTATGELQNPTISGDLRLENGRLDLSAYGVTLTDATLLVKPDGFNRELVVEGSVKSDGVPLWLTGDVKWTDKGPDLNLHVKGENFKLSDTSEALVFSSPNLFAHYNDRELNITGELHIPKATLKIQGYQSSISASPDVVILQEAQTENVPVFVVNTDVLLSLGKNINFTAGGLKTKLTGGIQIVKQQDNPPRASGQITSKNGSYAAYGQRLDIETGVLSFNNSPLDNPALNIEATRKITLVQRTSDQYIFSQSEQAKSIGNALQDGKVGLRITGTAQNPQYNLFSVPQLSEEDQLSYLLTGSPAGQLGAAQAAFMLGAIGEASGMLGFSDTDSASLQNITSNMGVDVSLADSTRIDPETGEAISDTNVVVGSALSPKLYVSYSVGLLDPVNIFQVRYQLSRRFALQSVTTSDGDTGGDIIYGIETDGLPWK